MERGPFAVSVLRREAGVVEQFLQPRREELLSQQRESRTKIGKKARHTRCSLRYIVALRPRCHEKERRQNYVGLRYVLSVNARINCECRTGRPPSFK